MGGRARWSCTVFVVVFLSTGTAAACGHGANLPGSAVPTKASTSSGKTHRAQARRGAGRSRARTTTKSGNGHSGTVGAYTFTPKALGKSVRYLVYLPPGYDASRNRSVRYPVIYLLHGLPGGPEDWIKDGEADRKMDSLISQKKVKPMILVMPQGNWSQFATSAEYVNSPKEGGWASYITRDLVGWIDSRYRTIKGADGRGIAGLSEGGFGAANLGLKNRAEFGVIGSFSGYFKMFPEDAKQLDSNDTRMLIQENSPALYLPNLRGKMPAFYLFVGEQDKDFLESEKQFAGQLSSLHVTHEFHTYPGKHAWSLWEKHLSGFFIFASAHLE